MSVLNLKVTQYEQLHQLTHKLIYGNNYVVQVPKTVNLFEVVNSDLPLEERDSSERGFSTKLRDLATLKEGMAS
jgi:hypothetical protein